MKLHHNDNGEPSLAREKAYRDNLNMRLVAIMIIAVLFSWVSNMILDMLDWPFAFNWFSVFVLLTLSEIVNILAKLHGRIK